VDLMDSLNYFYNANITAGAVYDYQIHMGARKYPDKESTGSDATKFVESEDVWVELYVPEMNIFADYDKAEEKFDEIFGDDDESKSHYDTMGKEYSHSEFVTNYDEDTQEYEYANAFSSVEFGYKMIPHEDEDDETYIGIIFKAEGPADKLVDGAKIINWAKYTQMDRDGNETENSHAVACIITVGDRDATEVRTFENTLDIESMDDDELDELEIFNMW
jgi:hypothetical protein